MKDGPCITGSVALSCQQSSHECRDVLQLTSCSDLRQPIIHSPHLALETFRPFLVKVTGAAQSDFGLVQLQVNRKLLLNWICLGVLKELDRTTIHSHCRGEWEMGSSCR